jgi:hypothetical protein
VCTIVTTSRVPALLCTGFPVVVASSSGQRLTHDLMAWDAMSPEGQLLTFRNVTDLVR